jgi:hypothetical protein
MKLNALLEIRTYLNSLQPKAEEYADRARQVGVGGLGDALDTLSETLDELIGEVDDAVARAS